VGVDRGVAVATTTSTGDSHDQDGLTPSEAVLYRRLQQQLAR
jgi:putative transposase